MPFPRTRLGAFALAAAALCAPAVSHADIMTRLLSAAGMGEEDEGAQAKLPAGTRVEKDIAYGDDPAQRMDVYIPAHTQAAGAPVIFMVHGGAWMIGDKGAGNVVANKASRWLPKGFVFISVNYRLVPKATPVEQAQDVAKALASAQARAKEWGADPNRFLLMGHSAGAHLVALVSADGNMALSQGAKPWLGTVALDSASMDVVKTMQDKHPRFYDRVFGSDPALWRAASPVHRLQGKPVAPFLLVCSSKRDDSCPQARAFADKINALGGQATVSPQDLKHIEINHQLGTPGSYTDTVEGFLRNVGLN